MLFIVIPLKKIDFDFLGVSYIFHKCVDIAVIYIHICMKKGRLYGHKKKIFFLIKQTASTHKQFITSRQPNLCWQHF